MLIYVYTDHMYVHIPHDRIIDEKHLLYAYAT